MSDKLNPDSPQQGTTQQSAPQHGVTPASPLELARALDELIAGQPIAGVAGGPGGEVPDVETEGHLKSSPGGCPQRAAWSLLFSGEAQPIEADELLNHAAECPACAKLLRSLTADPSAGEISAISTFSSSTSVWQKQLAVRLAETPHWPASETRNKAL